MTELTHELKVYLPQEQDNYLSELHDSIKRNSIEAWEAHADPKAQGVITQHIKEWSEAVRCVTFVQHVEDGKIVAADDEEMDKLQSLKDAANDTITSFVEKYGHLAPHMRPQNLVTEFLELAIVKLSTLDPLTLCLRLDLDPVRSEADLVVKFDTNPGWLAVKELDPDCYNRVRKEAAKALYWKQQLEDNAQRIVPIEVLGDVLNLCKIADNITAIQMDIKKSERKGKRQDIAALHSILQSEAVQFTYIIRKYPQEVQHENFHYSLTLLSQRYAVTPDEIIAEFGPGCLCVTWSEEQTETNEENLKFEQL